MRRPGEFILQMCLLSARHCPESCGISSKGHKVPALTKPIFWAWVGGFGGQADNKQENRKITAATDKYYGRKIQVRAYTAGLCYFGTSEKTS